MMRRLPVSSILFPVLSAFAIGAAGCDSAAADGSSLPNTPGGSTVDPAGQAGTGGTGSGTNDPDAPALGTGSGSSDPNDLALGPAGGNSTPITPEEICQTMTAVATPAAVDMYIILDQSISMAEPTVSGGTRWDAVTAAISSFVANDSANGIGVGIDYFGIGYDTEQNCDPSHYADPDVPIAELPGNRTALQTSLADALGPQSSSRTPTYAALDGALQYATAHATELQAAGSDRLTFVLLASDGFPTECEQSLAAIAGLASAARAADPPVFTHMIALTEGEANARAIADAGGGKSFIITADADVSQSFLNAMLSITTSNIPCNYNIDRGSVDSGLIEINSHRAAVSFNSALGGSSPLVRRDNRLDCEAAGGLGYYFDREIDPTQVVLCEDTCAEIGAGTLTLNLTCIDNGDDPTLQ